MFSKYDHILYYLEYPDSGASNPVLRDAMINMLSMDDCAKTQTWREETQLCAGDLSGGADTCGVSSICADTSGVSSICADTCGVSSICSGTCGVSSIRVDRCVVRT